MTTPIECTHERDSEGDCKQPEEIHPPQRITEWSGSQMQFESSSFTIAQQEAPQLTICLTSVKKWNESAGKWEEQYKDNWPVEQSPLFPDIGIVASLLLGVLFFVATGITAAKIWKDKEKRGGK